VPEGVEWFLRDCSDYGAYETMGEIERLLKREGMDAGRDGELIKLVHELSKRAMKARCPIVCGAAIRTLKRVTFLEVPADFDWSALSLAAQIWKAGRREDTGERDRRVFDPNLFLQRWEMDLPLVRPSNFAGFVRFLSFDDLDRSPNFDGACRSFVEHVTGASPPPDALAADNTACAFVDDVLLRLLDGHPECVERNLVSAVRLVVWAAGRRGTDCLRSLTRLVQQLLNKRPVANYLPGGALPEARSHDPRNPGYLWGAYTLLNEFARGLDKARLRELDYFFGAVLPLLGGWEPRKPRRVPVGWVATLTFAADGGADGPMIELRGRVEDVSADGHGYQIRLGPSVTCRGIGNGRFISGTIVVMCHEVTLVRDDQAHYVRTARLKLEVPTAGNGVETFEFDEAWMLRGFQYEARLNEVTDDAGVVIWIMNPVEALRQRIEPLRHLAGGSGLSGVVKRIVQAAPETETSDAPPPQATLASPVASDVIAPLAKTGETQAPPTGKTEDGDDDDEVGEMDAEPTFTMAQVAETMEKLELPHDRNNLLRQMRKLRIPLIEHGSLPIRVSQSALAHFILSKASSPAPGSRKAAWRCGECHRYNSRQGRFCMWCGMARKGAIPGRGRNHDDPENDGGPDDAHDGTGDRSMNYRPPPPTSPPGRRGR
jgi:hypothetical protein